ncbi:MAG TPA: hypothetical protein VG013_20605 [Gemmataceae bacterium]|nr:hypothetical protein [Gemmataceae bacterium]
MPAVLPDVKVEGQVALLVRIWLSEAWRDLWTALNYALETFERMGLPRDAPDTLVGQTCQSRQTVLVTANRNRRGPDSLEDAIRTINTPTSLPVVTLANPERLTHDRAYAERAAERLLDYLLNIENYRGVGRLYVP